MYGVKVSNHDLDADHLGDKHTPDFINGFENFLKARVSELTKSIVAVDPDIAGKPVNLMRIVSNWIGKAFQQYREVIRLDKPDVARSQFCTQQGSSIEWAQLFGGAYSDPTSTAFPFTHNQSLSYYAFNPAEIGIEYPSRSSTDLWADGNELQLASVGSTGGTDERYVTHIPGWLDSDHFEPSPYLQGPGVNTLNTSMLPSEGNPDELLHTLTATQASLKFLRCR